MHNQSRDQNMKKKPLIMKMWLFTTKLLELEVQVGFLQGGFWASR